ncbi:Zinc fingers and homeoboxes protein 1 [Varanus komodoensis]|nr:zinc fingers and homeoboxes protein 1 [Varanus komodoensis]XP_044277761.1 zinc fingers and homeoboxes protein 1 [Varanus komodoensis]XP_044277762.1 zinc fingers and homeoboxes protein 1 [Varanus komodoensis]XP_044277764.1 zinc fingers and homeoboxes protein 1 [Varanus komodoensis]XP_044277765.1 zinc fingers and homeoboxes protein 1 [Varanus komodoensis]XP_044277766.1 zinc fingers and homeoboxes protein 1 [Varanus komodoensis]XP_044277767.1 zinc fingers and homeoboxes protein 1 [Varanus kom
MASKRKSTTPCMVLASEPYPDTDVVSDVDEEPPVITPAGSVSSEEDSREFVDLDNQQNKKVEGGYECKYCTFQTPDLNMFTFHVDSEHPNVVLSSSYVCLECKFVTKRYDALSEHNIKYHPGEDNFKLTMVKRNNRTIFEQSVNDLTFDGSFVQEEKIEEFEPSEGHLMGISISKTPIMKMMKNKNEAKRIAVFHNAAEEGPTEEKDAESDPECEEVLEKPASAVSDSTKSPTVSAEAIAAVVNPTTVIQPAQVLTTITSPQNSSLISKVLIPINSIPAYNTALDNNSLLLNTYNKFPYPTVSEIALLATQAKYTEEQIKIWFSAQRLKHGVSWTPEEVEEARRKQFNGTVHTVPQTITVIPAHISAAGNSLPSILQTCQIVGQPGLVLTQVAGTGALPVTAPIALTVAGVPNQAQLQKAQVQATQPVTETKQVAAVPAPQLTKSEVVAAAANIDTVGVRAKKTKEQLTELKNSYLKNHFPLDSEIIRLMKITGLTKGEIKKWFSDTRYNQRNSKHNHYNHLGNDSCTIIIDSSDETNEPSPQVQPQQKQSWSTSDDSPQKCKEKTAEELQVLQDSFQNNPTLTDDELNRIRSETKLTRREIDAWFAEQKRADVLPDESEELTESNAGCLKEASAVDTSGGESAGASKMKLSKKSPEQLHMLKMSFVRTQWPSSEEYDKLAEETGLPRPEIVSWFGDTRYAWKNGSLKWYYYYQGANANSVNGQGYSRRRGRGRPKGRGRGRPRGRPRANKRIKHWDRTPVIKFKTGKAILKDYYLKHKFLNEQDLDELVAKSHMGYEQVREWFGDRQRRAEQGLQLFEEEDEEEELPDDHDDDDDEVEEEEEEEETDDSDNWEPPRHVRRKLSKSD